MTEFFHPAFGSQPDLSVSSASRVPTDPELKRFDRMLGGLVVNRWTYRLIRFGARFLTKPVDRSGVTISDAPDIGKGAHIVTPEQKSGAGAVILIHGGGLVVGNRFEALPMAAEIARHVGVPVICLSYRLAPDDPAPAAIEDCADTWKDVIEQAGVLGIDTRKIVIAGISAGGGLAAVLAQKLQDDGGIQPAAQVLVYPMLDDRTAARRDLDKPRHRVWSNRNNLFGWNSYLGHAPGEKIVLPHAVAARRVDLAGLPPAWMIVGTADLFLDECRAYAQRLSDAGVEADYVEIAGAIHGFDLAGTAMAKEFARLQGEFIARFVK